MTPNNFWNDECYRLFLKHFFPNFCSFRVQKMDFLDKKQTFRRKIFSRNGCYRGQQSSVDKIGVEKTF